MPPTTWKDVYPSDWLKAEDLLHRSTTVQIAEVTVEELRQPDGKKHPKLVAAFQGKHKKLALNKTQCQALERIAKSDAFSEWVGLVVRLTPSTAPNGRGTILIEAVPELPSSLQKD